VSLTADTIRIVLNDEATERPVPIDSVTRFEVCTGLHSHPWRGAGIGFLSGVLLGGIIGGATREGDIATEHAILIGAGFFGLVGTVVGAGVGALTKTERWEEVPLDQLQVQPVATVAGRFGLAVSLRF
jgi:hypothetical protein